MLAESNKTKKDKTQKKEVKEANMAERSDKQYKKKFQCKKSPFDLNNKKGSFTLSKAEGKLLEQLKQTEIQNIKDQTQQCACLKTIKKKRESFKT